MCAPVEGQAGLQFFQIVGSMLNAVITWLLVVLGWVVIQDQALFQEKARSNVQRIDYLRGLLEELGKV